MTTTEAMERAMAVAGEMTAADESDGERSRQSAAFTDLNSGPATFPLAAVVGHRRQRCPEPLVRKRALLGLEPAARRGAAFL